MEAIGPLHLMIYLFKIMIVHCYVKVGEGRLASNLDHVHIMFDSDGSDFIHDIIHGIRWNMSDYFANSMESKTKKTQNAIWMV